MKSTPGGNDLSRRTLLRKVAIGGAVGWTAPVILSTAASAAGLFTPKCAAGTVTAGATFVQTACGPSDSTVTITITFAGPCPCGGTKLWCNRKNAPLPAVSGTAAALSFSIVIPIAATVTITGKAALGCTDRDGDTQYAVYNWSMTATDNGGACASADSISAVTLSGRSLVTSVGCPSLLAAPAAPAAATPAAAPGAVRPA